ncbi:G5 domain-containing protein, partial [Streptococcus sp. SM3]|uniref:LPXTG cell wall anchor domain-containing protein n=1 Tax=Streptococcus sp. SM3 TaxID=2898231 RepID=UPI0022B7719C
QTAREELEGLLESVRKKDPKTELIEQAETLLASEMPTPQAFADMKEKLNKKLAPAEESHHVGSMNPSEVAPTVEVLPELVVETETTAYERQERPNANLLKGQRQLVQKGEEGQIRRLVEVDAQGNRILRTTEILKEVVPEITEVGTKVLSSNQPAEGVKDLVLEIPKLEIEEDTVVFERQERPNSEFLKGQRRIVQAGEEGQVRHLVEVDSHGNRTLRSSEVLKEAVPEITEVGTKVLSSNQPAEGVKDLVLEIPKLEIEEDTVAFKHQERPNPNLPVGQRQLVQAGVEGQIRRLVEVDSQGNRTLRTTEVLKEALPEIVEVGTKEEQDSQKIGQALLATPTNEKVGKELPNTGVTRDASLVALGLLGVMSGYGLLAGKKRENESI